MIREACFCSRQQSMQRLVTDQRLRKSDDAQPQMGHLHQSSPLPSGSTADWSQHCAVDRTQPVHTAATYTCTKPTQNQAVNGPMGTEWRLHPQLRSYWQLMSVNWEGVAFSLPCSCWQDSPAPEHVSCSNWILWGMGQYWGDTE